MVRMIEATVVNHTKKKKILEAENIAKSVWQQHSITLVEELFCLISISFVMISKVHSYITLHIYVTSALGL